MAKDKYGFSMKNLSVEGKKRLTSLECYLNAAGVKVREIKTELEFWDLLEAIYQRKIARFPTQEGMINAASVLIDNISRQQRRKMQKEYRGAPQRAVRNKIMDRLNAENEQFLERLTKKEYVPSKDQKDEFYKSWDWRKLRMEVLKEHGSICMCCGATPKHLDMTGSRVQIVVDHIKPLHHHWHLRLDRSNLQVLCAECNQGKGAWDETDHRPEPIDAGLRLLRN